MIAKPPHSSSPSAGCNGDMARAVARLAVVIVLPREQRSDHRRSRRSAIGAGRLRLPNGGAAAWLPFCPPNGLNAGLQTLPRSPGESPGEARTSSRFETVSARATTSLEHTCSRRAKRKRATFSRASSEANSGLFHTAGTGRSRPRGALSQRSTPSAHRWGTPPGGKAGRRLLPRRVGAGAAADGASIPQKSFSQHGGLSYPTATHRAIFPP